MPIIGVPKILLDMRDISDIIVVIGGQFMLTVSDLTKNRLEHLWFDYGLTGQDYCDMFNGQDGCCAICGCTLNNDKRTHVDHNHAIGYIRGLLCTRCNSCIGYAGDSISVLIKAITYLEQPRTLRKIRQSVTMETIRQLVPIVVADYESGMPVKDIAVKHNRTAKRVREILRKAAS